MTVRKIQIFLFEEGQLKKQGKKDKQAEAKTIKSWI